MIKKVVLSTAERLAILKNLPKQKLPSTLRNQILLENISKIKLHYRPICKNIGPSLQFVRKYGPAIKYYNPSLTLQKKSQPEGPLGLVFQVYKKEQEEPIVLKVQKMKSPEMLLERVQQINKGIEEYKVFESDEILIQEQEVQENTQKN